MTPATRPAGLRMIKSRNGTVHGVVPFGKSIRFIESKSLTTRSGSISTSGRNQSRISNSFPEAADARDSDRGRLATPALLRYSQHSAQIPALVGRFRALPQSPLLPRRPRRGFEEM